MGKHDDDIAHWTEQKRLDESLLRDYEDGIREEFEIKNGNRTNVTAQALDRVKSSIARVVRIISGYEKNNA